MDSVALEIEYINTQIDGLSDTRKQSGKIAVELHCRLVKLTKSKESFDAATKDAFVAVGKRLMKEGFLVDPDSIP